MYVIIDDRTIVPAYYWKMGDEFPIMATIEFRLTPKFNTKEEAEEVLKSLENDTFVFRVAKLS